MSNKLYNLPKYFHPGIHLADFLKDRHWTQKKLAELMVRPIQTINEIIHDKKQITPETACELGAVFGMSAEFWMNLESHYRLWLAKRNHDVSAIIERSKALGIVPSDAKIEEEREPAQEHRQMRRRKLSDNGEEDGEILEHRKFTVE